jgi:hypothetical protein
MAKRYSLLADSERGQRALSLLLERPRGLTDDEVDAITKWGHQSTTPTMRALRFVGLIRVTADTRATRRGKSAHVNVLSKA